MSITCVIPAYNEGEAIAPVVRRILEVLPGAEVVVVDDGSSDNTAAIAERAGARVLRQTYNLGNGAAVKAGILAASHETIVFLDADGQHPPEDVPKLLEYLGPYDMVVGARAKDANVSKFRRFGNWGLIKVAEHLTGHTIPDLTSGFRAMKRSKVLPFVHLFPQRYSYPTTITMCFLKSGHFVKFVPLSSIQRRQGGHSGIRPWRDGMRFINIMLRIIMLFDPQKIFAPLGGAFLALGLLIAAIQIATKWSVTGSAVLMSLAGLLILLFGLMADQIAAIRRELVR
jgi:glycosyltransferase involved in cell wall biosynthesis